MTGKILRTAKDYRIREAMNVALQIMTVDISPVFVDNETFLVNHIALTVDGHVNESKMGAAFTKQHFDQLMANERARKFFDYSNTLSSAVAAVEYALGYATSDNVRVDLHITQPLSYGMVEAIQTYLDKYINLCEHAQPWSPEKVEVNLTCYNIEGQAFTAPEVDATTFTVGTNGGKDSSLCNLMLTKLGYQPHRIELVKDHIGYHSDDESPSGMVHYVTHSPFFVQRDQENREYFLNSRKKVFVAPQFILVMFYYMPYLIHFIETGKEPRFISMGSELGCSNEWEIDGVVVPDIPFEEGVYAKHLFKQITDAVGYKTNAEIISPISGLYEVAIVNLLHRMGNGWTITDSCWSREFLFRDDTPACEFCSKCLRNKLIIRHLAKHGNYDAKLLDESIDSIVPISPSMYCYSISSTPTYAYLRGESNDGIDYANTMFESPSIIEFIGPEIYERIKALVQEYGFTVMAEPVPDFDLNLVPVEDLINHTIKHFYGHDHWAELPTELGDTSKYACMMGLPFEEEFIMQKHPLPLYSYFNIWKFYNDDGSEVRVKVNHVDHPFTKDGDKEVPTFTHPVVRNSLRWKRDKINMLNFFVQEGFITGYTVL